MYSIVNVQVSRTRGQVSGWPTLFFTWTWLTKLPVNLCPPWPPLLSWPHLHPLTLAGRFSEALPRGPLGRRLYSWLGCVPAFRPAWSPGWQPACADADVVQGALKKDIGSRISTRSQIRIRFPDVQGKALPSFMHGQGVTRQSISSHSFLCYDTNGFSIPLLTSAL